MTLWAWLAAPLIGLMLAMFGAGGGMTTVPIFYYGLGLSMKAAIASSLWVVVAVSLASLLQQRVWKQLNVRLLIWFAAGGIIGSWLGTRIGLSISDTLQGAVFGSLTCFVAWWMLMPKPQARQPKETGCHCAKTLLTGIGLGIVTGVFGVGGGFLMVPALLWLGLVDYRLAVAHSLLLIVVNASVAGIGYWGEVDMPIQPLLMIMLLAIVGSLFGHILCKYWPAKHLQRVFSVMLLFVGGFMLFSSLRDSLNI